MNCKPYLNQVLNIETNHRNAKSKWTLHLYEVETFKSAAKVTKPRVFSA